MTPSPLNDFRDDLAHSDSLLVGATLAVGMAGRAMDRGGVDFIVVSSASRFRIMGVHPLSALLPLAQANAVVESFGPAEFTCSIRRPVFAGLSVLDASRSIGEQVTRYREFGFAGVTNLPGVATLDGTWRAVLEERGFGLDRELEMMREARRQGLLTLAFAGSLDDATRYVADGVDIICLTFGPDAGGAMSISNTLSFDDLVSRARHWITEIRGLRTDLVCLLEGGPIATPDEMVLLCEATGARGYIGGSTIGRRPPEMSITDITVAYKTVAHLAKSVDTSEDQLRHFGASVGITTQSRDMLALLRTVSRIARTGLPVMINGENGTGKELVAKAIHRTSRRADAPLVTVNCAALPRELLESELFGHEAGAFTGAVRARSGRFESAHGATLFLDEIGDLELPLQAKLLRALENGEFYRLGSNLPRRADVRVICATNRDLDAMVDAGSFRRDLLYRLNAVRIRIPPLRERVDDIPLLARHFLDTVRREINPGIRGIDHSVYRTLLAHTWPGNVRELKHVLENAAAMCDNDVIDDRHLPELRRPERQDHPADGAARTGYPEAPDTAPRNEREWILDALIRHRFRRAETARALGLSRKTLYNKMRGYGLDSRRL